MIEAAGRVQAVLDDLTREAFEADWQRQSLVQRRIEIISEASRHLPPEMKARHPDIPGPKSPVSAMFCATATKLLQHPYSGSLCAMTSRILNGHAAQS